MIPGVRAHAVGWHSMRVLVWAASLIAWAMCASGCGVGIVATVLWIESLEDDGSGSSDALPQVTQLEAAPQGSRNRILITFTLHNDDQGILSAQVQYVEVAASGPDGPALPATPLPGSAPLSDLLPGDPVRFLWDAGKDLGGRSASVRIIVTPMEDGKEGQDFRSAPVLAGNTPVRIGDILIASGQDRSGGETSPVLLVSFTVADGESDPASLTALEIGAGGEERLSLLDPPIAGIPVQLPSSPAGFPNVLKIPLGLLDQTGTPEGLRAAAHPGFKGDLRVRIGARDFPDAIADEKEGSFLFDNNEAPFVQFLPLPAEKLSSGIIPIRYRLFDAERNPADVVLEVDTGDGLGFRPANEFPLPISEGTAALSTLPVEESVGDATPFHTFLWDAISQTKGQEPVSVRIVAGDREEGPASRDFLELKRGAIQVKEIPTGDNPWSFTTGDYDGDAFLDLLVLNEGSGDVDFLRGGPGGLTYLKAERIPVGNFPHCATSGDFNGDGYCDAAVANLKSSDLTVLKGTKTGLARWDENGQNIYMEAISYCGSADFNSDGFADLAVTSSNLLTLFTGSKEGLVRDGEIDLGRPCWTGGVGGCIGDFDGDAYPDIIVADQFIRNNVTFLTGGPDGLTKASDIPLSTDPWQSVVADFNRDGFDDAFLVNPGDHLYYLEGSKTGLILKQTWVIELFTQMPVVGDFNGDGLPDVAVTRPAQQVPGGFEWINRIVLLYGTNQEGLRLEGEYSTDGVAPYHVTSGDYDGDGFDDLLIGNELSKDVSFLRGGRDGPTAAGKLVGDDSLERYFPSISGDFDGDGLPEGLMRGPKNIWSYDGVRSGPVLEGLLREVGAQPAALSTADFDRDGFTDVLVGNSSSDDVTWLRGGTDGFARDASTIPAGKSPVALGTGDFDGDGFTDAVVANRGSNDLTFIPGGEKGLLGGREKTFPSGKEPIKIIAGDLNGDGICDAAAANFVSGGVTVLLGGREGPSPLPEIPTGAGAAAIALGDFDGDGFADLAVANYHAGSVSVLGGGPQGPQTERQEVAAGKGPIDVIARDFDGDGFLDLAVADFEGTAAGDGSEARFFITCIRGGSGGFGQEGKGLPAGHFPAALESADFDGDGFPDLAAANYGSESVSFYRGGPRGLVLSGKDLRVERSPRCLASSDFDGDGFPDLAVANEDPGTVSLLYGGSEGLERGGERACAASPFALCSGDFDGDGLPDLAAANAGSNSVSLFRQQYRMLHGNARIEPIGAGMAEGGGLLSIADPRNPARYRVEVDRAGFDSPGQVCVTPGSVCPLPQAEAWSRGKYLAAVADPITILRETGEDRLLGIATLLLRPGSVSPEEFDGTLKLMVFLRAPGSPSAAALPLQEDEIKVAELFGKKAITFPVSAPGTYLVAAQRDRAEE